MRKREKGVKDREIWFDWKKNTNLHHSFNTFNTHTHMTQISMERCPHWNHNPAVLRNSSQTSSKDSSRLKINSCCASVIFNIYECTRTTKIEPVPVIKYIGQTINQAGMYKSVKWKNFFFFLSFIQINNNNNTNKFNENGKTIAIASFGRFLSSHTPRIPTKCEIEAKESDEHNTVRPRIFSSDEIKKKLWPKRDGKWKLCQSGHRIHTVIQFLCFHRNRRPSISYDHWPLPDVPGKRKFQLQIDFPFAQWIFRFSFTSIIINLPFSVNGFCFVRWFFLSSMSCGAFYMKLLHKLSHFFSYTLRHNTQPLAAHQSRPFDISQILKSV